MTEAGDEKPAREAQPGGELLTQLYTELRSLAGVLMMVSHFIFAFHFGLMLFGLGRTSTVPTFLNPVEEEGSETHL